jgi:hypothetical protein
MISCESILVDDKFQAIVRTYRMIHDGMNQIIESESIIFQSVETFDTEDEATVNAQDWARRNELEFDLCSI